MMELHIPIMDFNPVMGKLVPMENPVMDDIIISGKRAAILHDSWGGPAPVSPFAVPGPVPKTIMTDAEVAAEGEALILYHRQKQDREYEQAFRKTKSNEQSRAEWGLPPNTPGQMDFTEVCKGIASSLVPDVGGYEGNRQPDQKPKRLVYGPSSGYEGPTGHINENNQIIPFNTPVGEVPKFTTKQIMHAISALNPDYTKEQRESALMAFQASLDSISAPEPTAHSGLEMILTPLHPKTIKLTDSYDFRDLDFDSNSNEEVSWNGVHQYQIQRRDAHKHFAGGQSVYIKKSIHDCKKDKMIPGREEEFDEHDVSGLELSDNGELTMVHLLSRDGVQHPHYEDRDQTPIKPDDRKAVLGFEDFSDLQCTNEELVKFSSLKSKNSDIVKITPNKSKGIRLV